MLRGSILSLLIFICALASWAQTPACFGVHRSLSDREIKERNLIESGQFVRSRSFYEYLLAFGAEFQEELAKLSPEGIWADMGAGNGIALRDFSQFKREKGETPPKLIGISMDEPSFDPDEKGVAWLGGKFYEDISASSLPDHYDVVTDYYGIFSYTSKVSEYLNSIFEKMPVGGKFFVVLANGDRLQKGTSLWRRVVGRENLISYLQSTPNLQVSHQKMNSGISMGSTVLVLTKKGQVRFNDLKIQDYKPGTPPKRIFTYSN